MQSANSKTVKRLLISSDDFGMCHAVNSGTVRAMTEGVVRSTNFLVPCPWFDEAVALAKRHDLGVGVHLCVTSEWDRLKWRPLTDAPSLCDAHGFFVSSYEALEGVAREDELRIELEAQILRVRSYGYEPTHLNNHMLVGRSYRGVRGLVQQITSELARRHRLPFTAETENRKLVHFAREHRCSSESVAETWKTLESWTAEGTYHLIGHAADPSPELEALCSLDFPDRPWASQYRLRDQAFFLDPDTSARLTSLGFELCDLRGLRLDPEPRSRAAAADVGAVPISR